MLQLLIVYSYRCGGPEPGRAGVPAGVHGVHDQQGDGERALLGGDRKRLPSHHRTPGPHLRHQG